MYVSVGLICVVSVCDVCMDGVCVFGVHTYILGGVVFCTMLHSVPCRAVIGMTHTRPLPELAQATSALSGAGFTSAKDF